MEELKDKEPNKRKPIELIEKAKENLRKMAEWRGGGQQVHNSPTWRRILQTIRSQENDTCGQGV